MKTLLRSIAWPPLAVRHYGNKPISTFPGVTFRTDRFPTGSIMSIIAGVMRSAALWAPQFHFHQRKIQPKCSVLTSDLCFLYRSLLLLLLLSILLWSLLWNCPDKLRNGIQRCVFKRNQLLVPEPAVQLVCPRRPITSQLTPSFATLCELWPCALPL